MTERAPPELLAALGANMPQAMRERAQWLLWRFERYEGDKKPRKVPYYASGRKRGGKQGSDEDRAALVALDVALDHLARGHFDGLGFAFLPGDGLIGIDIDGAISEEGEISPRAAAIIEACASYTEYSPSGRGMHIIVQGKSETFKDNRIGLEVFCGRQFFTCTGRRWPGTPDQVAAIEEGTLRRLRATVKAGKGAGAAGAPGRAGPAAADPGAAVRRYCLAALDAAVQAMRAAAEGGRNDTLNAQAFGLAQLVHTGGLSEAVLRASLADAARSVGLADSEIEATMGSAVRAGLAEPRTLPERVARRAPGAKGASTPSTGSAGEAPAGEPDGAEPVADDRWRRRLLGEGGKKDCRENVYLHLVHNPALAGLVGYDEFAHLVVKRRAPPWKSTPGEWTPNDDYLLGMWLAERERTTIKGEGTIVAGVAMAAFERSFHPVVEMLDALPAWDGVERLAHWMHECLGAADTTYTRLVGAWFVMGMLRRVRNPGCQLDYMIVLEGLQGKRKSSALRVLALRDEWFTDTPIRIGTPDALLSLAGKLVTEIAELDSFNRAESTAVKAFVTSRVDRVREPYARRYVDRPRSGVLVGSTNQSEYFKDPTGSRRFWPVACEGEIDLDKLRDWREQLLAEALMRLGSADPEVSRCWPTRAEEEQYLVPEQERREIVDPWTEKLAAWVDSKQNYGDAGQQVNEVESFTSVELLTKCLNVPIDRIDGGRQMATRVGISMHRLGWVKRRDARGARAWRYWRPGTQGGQVDGVGAAGGPAAGDEPQGEALHEF